MKNYKPKAARFFAGPKLPANAEDIPELRALRNQVEQLWSRADSAIACLALLEAALAPVGSKVVGREITEELKKSARVEVTNAVGSLIQLARDLPSMGQPLATAAHEVSLCAVNDAHNAVLRSIGAEEIKREDLVEIGEDENDF